MARNLSDLLHTNLSSEKLELIQRVARAASRLKNPVFLVGGFVRDLLLGSSSFDYDFVVEGDAIRLADALAEEYGGRVTSHAKFRTAKWRTDNDSPIDLISARSETYKHPAALPNVKVGSLQDDLHRRDFTINALAIRLDGVHFGEFVDELGGLDDLQRGLIRVLHLQSFEDDPTRMYRAVRYEQRYHFEITKETLNLIPPASNLIGRLSSQRIRHELDLILDEPRWLAMLARLGQLGLLNPIHLALDFDRSSRLQLEKSEHHGLDVWPKGTPNISSRDLRWLLWSANLSGKDIASLNDRLHFPASLFKSMLAASHLCSELPALAGLRPSQWAEKLDRFPIISTYAVYLTVPRGSQNRALRNYLSKWRLVKPIVTGQDLKKLGIQPGPKYQVVLHKLRNAWLDDEIATAHEEQLYLQKLLE